MKDINPIDKLFREELNGHKVEPSAAVWSKIEAAQNTDTKKAGGFYFLRAAVITLLIGLSSLLYFQQHQEELMNPLPEEGIKAISAEVRENAADENTAENNNQNSRKAVKPESGTKPKKETEQPTSKPVKKAVPLLSTPAGSSPILVQNEIKVVDEELLRNELENNDATSFAYEEIDASKVEQKQKYSITVKLPVVETYYGPDTTQPDNQRFSKKLWSYASNQVERVLAGEKPQWPKTNKEPELAFNVPRIFK